MKERIKFLVYYFIFWAIYFLAAKIIFLGYHILDVKDLTLETVFGIFYNGFKMDLSAAAYVCVLPFLWVTLAPKLKKSRFAGVLFTYTFIMVFINTFLIVTDLEVYSVWGYRIDATPIAYLTSPKEALASVSSSPIIQLTISFILLVLLSNYLVYRVISSQMNTWKHVKFFPFIIYGFIATVLLIIPIRGGFGVAPMNQSKVFFSKSNFANIAAINPSWNFFESITRKSYSKVNPYTYYPKNDINYAVNRLFKANGVTEKVLKTDNPNVIIVIWESLTAKVINHKVDTVEVTPNLNRFTKEGLYFSNIYATGDRTDKGLIGVLSAFPAQTTESIIKYPSKSAKLNLLNKEFSKKDYTTEFYYGGDIEFANIKSYLFASDYTKLISQDNFSDANEASQWGYFDHQLYNKFIADHKEINKNPFYSTILTLSSHEPFETPNDTLFVNGQGDEIPFMNAMAYADNAFGNFIEQAKKEPWWANTLIVVVADHGHRILKDTIISKDFKIPMLWLGGAVNKAKTFTKVGSQLDLASTLLNQLNMESEHYIWSKNLLQENYNPWAFYTFNDGFGFVTEEGDFAFNNATKKEIYRRGIIKEIDIKDGKILQQKAFQEFLDK